MSQRITLAENAVALGEVHMIVPDDRVLATLEALGMLSVHRLEAGTTPLNVARVQAEIQAEMVALLVEVDVTLARPPRIDAHTWTWVLVEAGPYAGAIAEEIACQMASCHPAVVMAVGARVIDWEVHR